MGRETYFPHLAILVPERQSCACLRGKKYTLRKIITRHSDHVPRLNLHSPAAPPVPHFPRFRALALFGRRPPQRVDSLVMPASENLHITGLMRRSRVSPFDPSRTSESYSGNPAFRRPSINSFAFDSPPRAIYADIVKAGSISSTRAAASCASASRPRWSKADESQ